ncbi:MAG: 3-deoxy-D-manno-octulosonic acid transferase [Syntrophobacteraceae bacterium]|nr:3-deoxy-D-manno-octulosonic acid transferase [Syntrophobacteraceae bacterium]
MFFLYSLVLSVWIAFMTPVFLYRALRHGKYRQGVAQRFGNLPEILRFDGRATIWFHTCSVGETLSIEPLVKELHHRIPEARLVFSTVTKTGQEVARRRFSIYGEGNTFYFPLDLGWVCKRFLRFIRPTVIVITDTEIWPNLLRQAHKRSIPVVMANGRISIKSARSYRFVRPVMRKVFASYAAFLMQSEEDARRIESLGAPSGKVIVSGNMKYDKGASGEQEGEKIYGLLGEALGISPSAGPVIVAGSTHEGEEQVLLDVLGRVRLLPGLAGTRLLLAPRHPERFSGVAELALRAGFTLRRRSEKSSGAGAQVLLLDSIGELATAYRFADIAFVGGTLIAHGGQNILEPAWHAKPIVIGPSMENFRQTAKDFLASGAVVQIQAGPSDRQAQIEELTDTFVGLLEDEEKRVALGRAARLVLDSNCGASEFTADRIAAIFKKAGKGA